MSFPVLVLGCQKGWVEHNDSFYCTTSNPQRTLREARQRCEEMSADLPIIKSQWENDFIANLMKQPERKRVWLGMKRNQSGFFWLDGSPAEPSQRVPYSAWGNNELRRNHQEEKNCAFLDSHSKRWVDSNCIVDKIYVICQKIKGRYT